MECSFSYWLDYNSKHDYHTIVFYSYFVATLIFNPLTYEIIRKLSWRWCYVIFGATEFIFSFIVGITFRPIKSENKDNEMEACLINTDLGNSYNTINKEKCKDGNNSHLLKEKTVAKHLETGLTKIDYCDEGNLDKEGDTKNGNVIPRRTQVILGCVFFLGSSMKCLGYYAPFVTMVTITW